MQVFVPYPSPIDVARCLDRKRLIKQCLECGQILAAIDGRAHAWRSHPVTKMYSGATNMTWLWCYRETLDAYIKGCTTLAKQCSYQCDTFFRPPFLTPDFCDQHPDGLTLNECAEFFYDKGKQAGAEWMAEQGVMVDGEICIPNAFREPKEGAELVARAELSKESGFKFGDKVRVQITKI